MPACCGPSPASENPIQLDTGDTRCCNSRSTSRACVCHGRRGLRVGYSARTAGAISQRDGITRAVSSGPDRVSCRRGDIVPFGTLQHATSRAHRHSARPASLRTTAQKSAWEFTRDLRWRHAGITVVPYADSSSRTDPAYRPIQRARRSDTGVRCQRNPHRQRSRHRGRRLADGHRRDGHPAPRSEHQARAAVPASRGGPIGEIPCSYRPRREHAGSGNREGSHIPTRVSAAHAP